MSDAEDAFDNSDDDDVDAPVADDGICTVARLFVDDDIESSLAVVADDDDDDDDVATAVDDDAATVAAAVAASLLLVYSFLSEFRQIYKA